MSTELVELLSGHALEVAPRLLGMTLQTLVDGDVTAILLNEVEAYGGSDDPASHAFRGRTPRNHVMFGPPGVLYVYRSYGIHWCANIVTGQFGDPQAVLLRGGFPLDGVAVMKTRRGRSDKLADGPGNLTQALGIGASDNGQALGSGRVALKAGLLCPAYETTPRVGVTKATGRPWRFRIVTLGPVP